MNRIELPTSQATSTADLSTQPCWFFHTESTDFRNWDRPTVNSGCADALGQQRHKASNYDQPWWVVQVTRVLRWAPKDRCGVICSVAISGARCFP